MSAEILLFQRLKKHQGAWMEHPDTWLWHTPARQPQGFGLFWRDNVGLANLLWLALDMDRPPEGPYNMRYHPLCSQLVTYGGSVELEGLPLFDHAASQTLAQFRNLCYRVPQDAPPSIRNLVALLEPLANRRLAHAHA